MPANLYQCKDCGGRFIALNDGEYSWVTESPFIPEYCPYCESKDINFVDGIKGGKPE